MKPRSTALDKMPVSRLVPEEVLSGGYKRPSPTGHLKALRAPCGMVSNKLPILENGRYLSPSLHNASDTWVRHLRNTALRHVKDPYPERRPENKNIFDRQTFHHLRTWTTHIRHNSRGFFETKANDRLERDVASELKIRAERIEKLMSKSQAIGRDGEMGEEFGWQPNQWFDIKLQLREEKEAEEHAAALISRAHVLPAKPYEWTLCDDSDNEYSSNTPEPQGDHSLLSSNWADGSRFTKLSARWKLFTPGSSSNPGNELGVNIVVSVKTDMGSVGISDRELSRTDTHAIGRDILSTPVDHSASTEHEPWKKYGPTIGQARYNKFLSDLRAAREEVLPADYRWQRPPMHYKRCEEWKYKSLPGLSCSAYIISLFVTMAEDGIDPSKTGSWDVYSTPPSTQYGACTVVFTKRVQNRLKTIGFQHRTSESAHNFMASLVNRVRMSPAYIKLNEPSRLYHNLPSVQQIIMDLLIPESEYYNLRELSRERCEKEVKFVGQQKGKRQDKMYECFDVCRVLTIVNYTSDLVGESMARNECTKVAHWR